MLRAIELLVHPIQGIEAREKGRGKNGAGAGQEGQRRGHMWTGSDSSPSGEGAEVLSTRGFVFF